MPVYEFKCNACGANVSLFFRSMNSEASGVCDRCGSADLHRMFSRFAVLRPAFKESDINKDELLDGVNYDDPHSMAAMFRRMKDQFQDGPNDYLDDVIERLDYGEDIQKTLGIDDHSGHDHGTPPIDFGDGGSDGDHDD
jgi:putative FmdB family regulatory protein